ncbi:MAG: NADH-quinone oxidoreductase subunit E, partial [Pseudomonadota bacterium]
VASAAETAPMTYEARPDNADDLKLISGVGPKLEETLNDLGFYTFEQIAGWTPENVAYVDARLKFKGRIERDDWITKAKDLAAQK